MGANQSSQIAASNSRRVTPSICNSKKFIIGIIDVQNDFCKGGKLAIAEAEEALAAINKLRYIYHDMNTFISQDWHNKNHMSFAETHKKPPHTGPEKLALAMEDGSVINVEQMMWPRHCVENTVGSRLHNDLITTVNDIMIKKGTKQNVESYSAFGDEFQGKYENTKLHEKLQALKITDIILTGIASDYCVYNTGLDAVRLGYKVHLILSCTRGVAKATTDKAIADLRTKGVTTYRNVNEFYETNKSLILDK
jgi:nicotinamidase/pyrazinamidase